jgi:hypothetical protein
MNLDRILLRRACVSAAAAALSAGCATARLASGWARSAVIANGSVDDWVDKYASSTMKGGLQLTVANDDDRLYAMARFRANDERWVHATSHGGMTLRVAGPGKRVLSFRLPRGPERAPGERPGWSADSMPGKTGDSPTERPRQTWRGTVPVFPAEFVDKLVVTDVDKNVVPVDPEGSQGPAAGFSSDNGMCTYEFSVPLRDSAVGRYSLGAGVGTGLNLTVTAGPGAAQGEITRGEMQRDGGQPQGGGPGREEMPGSRRGFGRGGPGRGGPQGGPPGGHAVASPSVSIALRLAAAP